MDVRFKSPRQTISFFAYWKLVSAKVDLPNAKKYVVFLALASFFLDLIRSWQNRIGLPFGFSSLAAVLIFMLIYLSANLLQRWHSWKSDVIVGESKTDLNANQVFIDCKDILEVQKKDDRLLEIQSRLKSKKSLLRTIVFFTSVDDLEQGLKELVRNQS